MGYEQDLEQKRQFLKLGKALAENDKFTEALLSCKPIPVLPNINKADRVELTYLANEQAMLEMTDALKANPQVWGDATSLWANLCEQIADDIERMGAQLIELGFPDPRKDHSNWRIIAIMVGADPDGMMEDIFEHAIAYDTKCQQVAKQVEALENKSVALKPGSNSKKRCLSDDEVEQQEIEDALFKRWQEYSKQEGLRKNKTKAFLESNRDIANEYSEQSFKALVDKVRKRKPKRKVNR